MRFNLTIEQLPLIKLFVGGKDVAQFDGEMTCDNLRQFVEEHTGTGTDDLYTTYMEHKSPSL